MLRRVLITAALAALGVVAFFALRGGGSGASYVTETVGRGDVTDVVSATGRVSPVVSVSIGTQISGTIEKIHVDHNDQVKKGQLLIELDREVYRSRGTEAESVLRARRA